MDDQKTTGIEELYSPPEDVVVEVNVPKLRFLMIDGQGAPGSEGWINAAKTLFAIDQALRANLTARGIECPPVFFESLWWAENTSDLVNGRKDKWLWTCMLRQPDVATVVDLKKALVDSGMPIDSDKVRIDDLEEGLAVQKLHVGPMEYALEDILKLRAHIRERGGAADGRVLKLHQVDLSDMINTNPEKLRVIFRQPFRLTGDGAV